MSRLSSASFGLLLTYSPSRIARHLYIATAVAGTRQLALSTAIKMPDATFSARLPGFPAWLGTNAGVLGREHAPLVFRPGARVAVTAADGVAAADG